MFLEVLWMSSSIHLYVAVYGSIMSYGFLKVAVLNRFNLSTKVWIRKEFCKLKFSHHADFFMYWWYIVKSLGVLTMFPEL